MTLSWFRWVCNETLIQLRKRGNQTRVIIYCSSFNKSFLQQPAIRFFFAIVYIVHWIRELYVEAKLNPNPNPNNNTFIQRIHSTKKQSYFKPPARNVLRIWSAETAFASIFPAENHVQMSCSRWRQIVHRKFSFFCYASKTAEIMNKQVIWVEKVTNFVQWKLRWAQSCFCTSRLRISCLFSTCSELFNVCMLTCTVTVT